MSKLTNHATEMKFERYPEELKKRDIENALSNVENITYLKRLSETRSLIYLKTPTQFVKAIIQRRNRKVITLLPWNDKYKVSMGLSFITPEGDKKFAVVDIFPDCFKETECNRSLTKISILHDDDAKEPIGYTHYLFDLIFNYSWRLYKNENIKERDFNIQGFYSVTDQYFQEVTINTEI